MCDPCEQMCCSPCCDPCSPPSCCDPCCPPSCSLMCPPDCLPMCPPCPSPCSPCPPMCSPCPSPCSPCSPCPPACDPCCPPKRCKSRELRGGVLLTNCDCVKRNGLQLDCPRTECKGRPCCTVKPWPLCCPSKYTWRYSNVTMGKPTNPPRPGCKPRGNGTCNPCVASFDPCCNDC
ncbi:late cornified envelope protein 5A-like [Chironomus tepperi]|uniref:late cornified envelope protein 5A-like n=1 Tax=Chironomus tepperi TaxID=113505 RepID=UPI00391F7713